MAQNEQTNWYPPTIKWGRYGDWLTNNVDWALSRNRYWGTPLPIWRCEAGHLTAIGSLDELSSRAGKDVDDLDPHRPFVDDVAIQCPECENSANRVPEVIDCWYDSGAMPFAALGYPRRNVEEFAQQLADGPGVLVMPASVFDFSGNFFRIGFGRTTMPRSLERFTEWVDTHRHSL